MVDTLGLGTNATNVVTSRPADTRTLSTSDTWLQDCSSPSAQDGTIIPAAWLNSILANLRGAIRGSGLVTEDNADTMLFRAISGVSSLASSGYQKLPSGLIVQWGTGSQNFGPHAVTFPITFPNAVFCIVANDNGASTWSASNVTVLGTSGATTSGFSLNAANWTGSAFQFSGVSVNFGYVAIGK